MGGLNTSLTSSPPPGDPGTDQTEQNTRDDHGDRGPNKGESQTHQIGHWMVPPCVIEACRSAIHAAPWTARHGVRSHPVPVALVGECSIPVV